MKSLVRICLFVVVAMTASLVGAAQTWVSGTGANKAIAKEAALETASASLPFGVVFRVVNENFVGTNYQRWTCNLLVRYGTGISTAVRTSVSTPSSGSVSTLSSTAAPSNTSTPSNTCASTASRTRTSSNTSVNTSSNTRTSHRHRTRRHGHGNRKAMAAKATTTTKAARASRSASGRRLSKTNGKPSTGR